MTAATGLLAVAVAVAVAFIGATLCVADASALRARYVAPKPSRTVLSEADDPTRIEIKFSEGSAVRLRSGRLQSSNRNLDALAATLTAHGVGSDDITRLFRRPEADLDRERSRGQRSSRHSLADLNLYYVVRVPAAADTAALCDALNALDSVEFALPALAPVPLPVDLPPMTPDLTADQNYKDDAPNGTSSSTAIAGIAGADGAGISIVDVEYNWVLDHEDLELPPEANIEPLALEDPFPEDESNHGTAAIGILRGLDNGYGITGIAPAAELFVAPANTASLGYNPAHAINLAASVLDAGDVILVEQQATSCSDDFGPAEWRQSVFDAVSAATALGIVVVEAAGNGDVDLDAGSCLGLFDREVRDSGAIIVGAGSPTFRSKLSFSSYGSRVDVQGWGLSVATTGYDEFVVAGDIRQRYTQGFNGTSSASAIVAGVAAAVQGGFLAGQGAALSPAELRDLLVATGSPQTGNLSEHIGPLPDIVAAVAGYGCGNDLVNAGEQCDGTDDSACPGACIGAGEPNQCQCAVCGDDTVNQVGEQCDGSDPGICTGPCLNDCTCSAIDNFLCYKAKAKDELSVLLSDLFDGGVHEGGRMRQFCTAASIGPAALLDPATHLAAYSVRGDHERKDAVSIGNLYDSLGPFTLRTKKAEALLTPASLAVLPDLPPGLPDPGAAVGRYRCIKASTAGGTAKFPSGIETVVTDAFATRTLRIKQPSKVCVATDVDGGGIADPDTHLVCYRVKPDNKTKVAGAQFANVYGQDETRLKSENELCVPSSVAIDGGRGQVPSPVAPLK